MAEDTTLLAAAEDPEKLAALKQDLIDHRDSKKAVARISNKSAANRSGKLLRRFREEVRPLLHIFFFIVSLLVLV